VGRIAYQPPYRPVEIGLSPCEVALVDLKKDANLVFPERDFLKGHIVTEPMENDSELLGGTR
jgi:hypothetical protein